ncbi:hypothetical protein HID58_056837 [Brassica napus]|uniref:Uncharacterized protein n=1 Tax=Brassica napus TaxID=3708 RepID=A0ABQ8APJ9_BRANA|nr:hypothetical protein HID58_056837 [Brassica napus]
MDLKTLEQGVGFGGRIVRAKRVQERHVTMTIEQETKVIEYVDCFVSCTDLDGSHLHIHNYGIAEQHYRELCVWNQTGTNLMRMGRISEAQTLIIDVRDSSAEIDSGDVPFSKSYDREPSTRDVHFANGITKDNKAPGNVYMNYSHPSSPVLDKTLQVYLHNRGSKWYQRPEMYEEETRAAGRKLLFKKPA